MAYILRKLGPKTNKLTIDARSGPSVQGNRSKVPFKGHLLLLQKQCWVSSA